jgi:hypothetical protein
VADQKGSVAAGRELHAVSRLPSRKQVHAVDAVQDGGLARGRAMAAAARGDKVAREALAAADYHGAPDDHGPEAA